MNKDRQHNDQKKNDKRTNNYLQNIKYKTKDRVTLTLLKPWVGRRFSGRVSSSCSTSDIRRVNLVTNPVISHELGKGPGSAYDEWNISVVICDTDIA